MKRKLFIILIIFIWGSTLVFSPFLVKISQADDSDIDVLNLQIKEQRKQLETLQKKQKQYLDSIKRISQEKDSLKTQIELLGERVGKTELEIEEVKLQINETNLEISKITIEIQQTNERIEKEKGHIASLLRLVYKQDQSSTLEILMLNDSLNDFLNQAKYLENTNKEIAKSLESLKNDKVKMEDNKKQLDDKNLQLAELKKQLEERKVALEYEVQNKTLFLEQTRQSETRYQSLLSKAKEQQDSASSEITDLEKKVRERLAQKAKEKEGKEGSEGIKFSDKGFIWPVPQSYITSKFHDPDYPFRRSLGEHSAADIKASQGTPLKAAASGYIARVKFDGSRNYAYIMIIHGDGLSTVYGHVSGVNIKADEYVVQGQVIGQTGGLPGTPGAGPFSTGAHLHFEVRKDGIPVDPEEYLPK